MLIAAAIQGFQATSWRMRKPRSSAPPHSLQKEASLTTTGRPQKEQKRGADWRGSNSEVEFGIAQLNPRAIHQKRLVDSLAAHISSVLTTQILQIIAAVLPANRRVMARYRLIGHD